MVSGRTYSITFMIGTAVISATAYPFLISEKGTVAIDKLVAS
jgi:hypothetical protein